MATIVWLIGSAGFSSYVGTFGTYNQTYGALAGVIVVNLWLFLSAFTVLSARRSTPSPRPRPAATPPTVAPEPMGRRGAVKADEPGPRGA